MKCLPAPADARVVLIDGPVAVFIQEASKDAILEAYERLGRLVAVAAEQLNKSKELT